jgi:hypothetical protein
MRAFWLNAADLEAVELLQQVRALADDFYESDARERVRDHGAMADDAADRFHKLHPEIDEEAIQPLRCGQTLLAHTRVRRDRVDRTGCFTLRYRSKLHHVAVGRAHKSKRVLVLLADLDIRVIDENWVTLRHLELDQTVDYQGRVRDIV